MAKVRANGIEIEYESYGDPRNETVLLIMGVGTQLTYWPDPLHEQLTALGFHVVRFDNRDIGLSSKFNHVRVPNIRLLMGLRLMGVRPPVPYTLGDMAEDAIGLLDGLKIDRAHVVGVSMGGMIAQLMAAKFPERVRSLTSIMSTTGNPRLPTPELKAMSALLSRPKNPNDPGSIVDRAVRVQKVLASPAYPRSDHMLRERAQRSYSRSYNPQGVRRQLAAIAVAADRRPLLRQVQTPSMVLHGERDPLVKVECGRDTARNLPNAELRIIPGMGHDLPDQVVPLMVRGISDVAGRSR